MEISIICDTGVFEKRCRLRKTNKRTRCVKNECFSARDILWGRIKHYEKSSLRSHYRFRCALTSVPTPFGFLLLKKNISSPQFSIFHFPFSIFLILFRFLLHLKDLLKIFQLRPGTIKNMQRISFYLWERRS